MKLHNIIDWLCLNLVESSKRSWWKRLSWIDDLLGTSSSLLCFHYPYFMMSRQINANDLVVEIDKKSVDHGNACVSETVKLIKTGWMSCVWISTRLYIPIRLLKRKTNVGETIDGKRRLGNHQRWFPFPFSSMFRDSASSSVPVSREISLIFGKLEGGRFTNDAKYARFTKPPNNLIGLRQISKKEEESISSRP